MKFFLKLSALLLGLVSLAFGLIPLAVYHIFHMGVLALLVQGLALVALPLAWEAFPDYSGWGYPLESKRWWRILRRVLAGGLALAMSAAAVLSVVMTRRAWFQPPREDTPSTVVVLGCLVRGTQPSLMLRYRLDAAAEYLLAHPQLPVVVSGGQGPEEEVTEAAAMAHYLAEKGINESRIYKEDKSTSTRENLDFTAALLKEQNLPQSVVLVTDGYHQLRAGLYGRRAGLAPAAVSGRTPWGLAPAYWYREFFAVAKAVFLE